METGIPTNAGVHHGMQIALAVSLLVLMALVACWDIYCWATGRLDSQVSMIIHEWSHKFPPFVLSIGFLLGHLFWHTKE